MAGFWLLQRTTPERIGSLALFVIIALYCIFLDRLDVAAITAFYFGIFDVNQWLFDLVLPIWISLVVAGLLTLVLWAILFGGQGWFLAIAALLIVSELLLSLQYINIETKLQAFIAIIPFALASQFWYFQLAEPSQSTG